MADTVERLIFDDSQAVPVLNKLTEAIKSTAKEAEGLNKTMESDAKKAADAMAASEAKLGEAVTKTAISMKEARAELGNKIKAFGAFGVTIGGGIEKLREMKDMLTLFRQGFIGSVAATKTQQEGIERLTKVFGGGQTAIKGFVTGMNLVRVAVLSTGIGALLIALGALVTFFTRTNEGAEILQKKMAGFKAIFTVVSNSVAGLGKSIYEAFNNPKQAVVDLYEAVKENIINRFKALPLYFKAIGDGIKAVFSGDTDGAKKALQDFGQAVVQFTTGLDKAQQAKVGDALGNIVKEASAAQKAAENIWQRQDDLYDQETAQILKIAKLRVELSKQRLLSNDDEQTFARRIEAAKKAAAIEAQIIENEVRLSKQKAQVLREEIALKGASATDEDRRAAAEAAAQSYEIEASAFRLRKSLSNQIKSLEKEEQEFYKEKVETLQKLRGELLGLATDAGIISGEENRLATLQKQLDNLKDQEKQIQAMGEAFQLATGVNPFVKDLELIQALTKQVEIELRKVEPLEPISQATNQQIAALRKQIEDLKKVSVEFNVDTSQAQKDIEGQIKEILRTPIDLGKERIRVTMPKIDLIPPGGGGGEAPGIGDVVDDFFSDIDNAEDLLNKGLKKLFGEQGGKEAREFIAGLDAGFSAYSSVLQESLSLQIAANEELIKQRSDQRQKLEDELAYELDLQKEGLANNVGTKQEEIASLLAEEERYQKENEELKKKAARNQLIADTIQQSTSLITSSINIIKGFSNIPVVGLPLGIAAVGALLSFFAATKAKAFAATKLHTGARHIDDHFGFADRHGDSDLNGGSGYMVVNARTGKDTNVRISGREMLLRERESLLHEGFLSKFSKGAYNDVPLEALADHYHGLASAENTTIINNTIIQGRPVGKRKQYVPFVTSKGRQGAVLLEIPDDKAVGSKVWFDL